jgi:hypothetical protein
LDYKGKAESLLTFAKAMRPCLPLTYALYSSSLLSRPSIVTAFHSTQKLTANFHRSPSFAIVSPHLSSHLRHHSSLYRHLSQQLDAAKSSDDTGPSSPKARKRKMAKSKDDTPSVPHAPDSLFSKNTSIDQTRTKLLTLSTPNPRSKESFKNPCIIYWMIRDVRTIDNWALLFAESIAIQNKVPLRVVYTLPPPPADDAPEGEDGSPPNPADMSLTERHGVFLLDGLKIVAEELIDVQVPFDVLCPASRDAVGETICNYANSNEALAVVCDMSPLRAPRCWTETQTAPLLEGDAIPLYQVDAHNVVPVWVASPKREVGARTLRPKIHNVFGGYCCTFPEFKGNAHVEDVNLGKGEHDWEAYKAYMKLDESIKSVDGMVAGHEAAMKRWKEFCSSTQQGL